MFQTINRLQRILFDRLGKPFRRIKPSNRGQTAIILMLVIAVALIIYAISLNWARVTQYKTMTTIASNTAAANMASVITSYGEQQLQVNLGGRPKYCKRTNFLVMIVVIIIVIIIVIVSWGTATFVALGLFAVIVSVAAIALAVAALIINLAVIQPGLTRLWNRMQDKLLTMEDKVVENGIMTALQSVVTDQVNVDDHFDMDTDGLWVDKNGNGKGDTSGYKDKISRFGYYYTWRLKQLQPMVIPGVDVFMQNLNELIYNNPYGKGAACTADELLQTPRPIKCQPVDNFGLFDPRCSSTSRNPSPYCNPCCQPVTDPGTGKPLRPQNCPALPQCPAGDYPAFPLSPYQWQYDPYYENDTNNATTDPNRFLSFREKLGVDDENEGYLRNPNNPNHPPPQSEIVNPNDKKFQEQDTTGYYTNPIPPTPSALDRRQGVFPFFWEMGYFQRAVARTAPVLPKTDDVTIVAVDPADLPLKTKNRFRTPNATDPNYDASICAIENWEKDLDDTITPDGFWWKTGSDQYCSTTYPYNDCSQVIPSGTCSPGTFTDPASLPSCGCVTSTSDADKDKWHEDPVDNMVYGLKAFIGWGKYILELDPDVQSQTFNDWYSPSAAQWIAPMCKEEWNCTDSANPSNSNQLNCAACNAQPMDGMLLVWHKQLAGWVDLLDDWLYKKNYADPISPSWCLPSTDISTLPFLEQNAIRQARLTALATPVMDRLGTTRIWPPPAPIPPATDVFGALPDTIACLEFNAGNPAQSLDGNPAKLLNCQTACTAAATTVTACQAACVTTTADSCLNLPRSVVDLKNSSSDGLENTAYIVAQQLQDCLNSTCTDPLGAPGNVLPVCGSLPVPVGVTTSCVGFGPIPPPPPLLATPPAPTAGQLFYEAVKLARDTQFAASKFCEPVPPATTTAFQNNLVTSITNANTQDTDIKARLAYLTRLIGLAKNAKQVFLDGYTRFNAFLKPCVGTDPNDPVNGLQSTNNGCAVGNNSCPDGGPAAQLICARREYFNSMRGLSNFAIYGWQSSKIIANRSANAGGYWHLVRVEAFVPKRCYHQCLTDKFPKVRTYIKWKFGWFGPDQFRCYELVNTEGLAIARVTRYDEDHELFDINNNPMFAQFANGQKIWNFRFNNPGGPALPVRPTGLGGTCDQVGTTLSPKLLAAGTSGSTMGFLRGAFMINGLPGAGIGAFPLNTKFLDPNTNVGCWNQVNNLLARGVQTTTCAKYTLDRTINHMSLKFVPCTQVGVDVDKAIQCAAGGVAQECK